MRIHLFCVAAAAAIAAMPAGAQAAFTPENGAVLAGGAQVRVHRDGGNRQWRGDGRRDRDRGDWGRRDGDRRDGRYGDVYPGYYDYGAWALYNNRGWESDSFNDWWHDRPDRAAPRWTRDRRTCREYWSGGGWTC